MIRCILPVVFLASTASAQTGGLCENIPYSQDNCVRVLACVGDQGITFDGQSRGWDQGRVDGAMSDGTLCSGHWDSNGPMGTGIAKMTCDDGTEIDVIYYSQDNITGTVIGEGRDSRGRAIRVWSGLNVVEFLTDPGAFGPALPCIQGNIPLS